VLKNEENIFFIKKKILKQKHIGLIYINFELTWQIFDLNYETMIILNKIN
jgi:hypothetical protein